MKPIQITPNGATWRARLQKELDAVQGRCKARTVTVDEIQKVLRHVEDMLGVSKKALAGVEVHYTGAEQVASAYRFVPESTHFIARHNGSAWTVVDIRRAACPDRVSDTQVTMPEETQKAVIDSLRMMCSL